MHYGRRTSPLPLLAILVVFAPIVMAVGCGGELYFDGAGLNSKTNHYLVPYDTGTTALLDEKWRVTNFRHEDGRPEELLDQGAYASAFDWVDRNGKTRKVEAMIYDLELSHTSNATIWIRVLPIPRDLLNKDVGVLAENYVNGLSRSAGSGHLGGAHIERRVATKILSSTAASLLNRRARVVTFDLVNLDQLEMDEKAPRTRVELVLVKIPFVKELRANQPIKVQGYLLAGYSNDAGAFDEHLKAFRRLVQRITLVPQG